MSQRLPDKPLAEVPDLENKWFSARVDDIRQGDPHVWSQLVRRFTPMLMAHAARKGAPQAERDDVVSTTFLRLWKSRDALNAEQNLLGYLYRICESVVVERWRWSNVAGRRWASLNAPSDDGRKSATTADRIVDPATVRRDPEPSSRIEALERALERLNLLERWILEQRYILGVPHEEIARDLGISLKVFYGRLHRIREKVRRDVD